jgi:hypothetical protein
MKMKRIVTWLFCLIVLFVAAGCVSNQAANSTPADDAAEDAPAETDAADDPMEMITNGYYIYSYPVEGLGNMTYYFHFYEERPNIGSVFYAGFCLNQINYAGTYTVEESPFEYSCYESREKQENQEGPVSGTAGYTITFYDWDGNVLDSCGFDGEYLYNDMETISAIGTEANRYAHDTEGEASKYIETYAAEVGQSYLSFVGEEDVTSTLDLFHNGTYRDMVNMMIEGIWTMNDAAEGFSYTLTPNSETDTAAELTIISDKSAAVYTPDGGEAVNMINAASAGPKVSMILSGSVPIPGQDGSNADLAGNLYEDGTCDLAVSAFGQTLPLDSGTYTMGEDGYTITFKFDNAGEIVSALGETGVSIHYVQAGTNLGDIDTDISVGLAE